MELVVNKGESAYEVRMNGHFTFHDNPRFKELLRLAQSEELQEMILDLAGVDFMDSAALGMLLLLRDEASKHKLTIILRHPRGMIEKTLTLSNFDELFLIEHEQAA